MTQHRIRIVRDCTPSNPVNEYDDVDEDTMRYWQEGEVYGFILERLSSPCAHCGAAPSWEEIDSCWGFYGPDPFENGISYHVTEEFHTELRNATFEY
jgi:hypothetical protein